MIGMIKYGAVQLECTRVNEVRRDVLLSPDGVDYWCTQVTVNVTAIWNPEATSYASILNGVPQMGRAFAGRTDRILFDYLSKPRRQLVLWTFDADGSRRIYLESPPSQRGNPLPSDVRNGPVCKVFSVRETFGIKTFEVHLQFVTWINHCYDNDSPIISHRFETTVDYDQDHFQTQTTRGTVLFNVGRLWLAQHSPDFYREQLFAPPEPNFARDHVNVQISSDNTQATYTVIDAERAFNLGHNSPATRLEATVTTWVSHGSLIEAAAQSAPAINQHLGAMMPQMSDAVGPFGFSYLGRQIGSLWNTATAVGGNVVGQLPEYYANFRARAHGGRTSKRDDLARLCMALAHSWLGEPTFFGMAYRTEVILTQSVAQTPFVELDMTLRWSESTMIRLAGVIGPPGSLAAIIGSVIGLQGKTKEFLASFYTDSQGLAYTQDVTHLEGDPRLNCSQDPIGNRHMNTGEVKVPRVHGTVWGNPNPNSPFKDCRGPGDLKYIITAALLGQCDVPDQNPPTSIYGVPGVQPPASGIYTVPNVTITPLESAQPLKQG